MPTYHDAQQYITYYLIPIYYDTHSFRGFHTSVPYSIHSNAEEVTPKSNLAKGT